MGRDFRYDTESEPNMRTSSPVSELVDLLLKVAGSERKYGFDGAEAALRGAASTLTTLSTRNAELEREVKRLREALQPFADIADLIDSETEGMSETDELALHFHDYLMASWPVALFRAARRVREGGRDA